MVKREPLKTKNVDAMDALPALESELRINEHALDEALIAQPEAFYRVSKRLALTVSRRDAAKQALSEEEARCDAQFREDAAKSKEKLTEAEIRNLIRLDKDVQRAQEELNRLNFEAGQLLALKEAFQQRSYVLKDLTSLHIANYYSSESGGAYGTRLKNVQADHAREGMNRMRRQRNDTNGD